MLLLVFALVEAPDQGWGATSPSPSSPGPGGGRVHGQRAAPQGPAPAARSFASGLAAADVTQLIAIAGFLAVFFFLTLYMQNVLGYSPIETGLAYLPVTAGAGIAAGISRGSCPAREHDR